MNFLNKIASLKRFFISDQRNNVNENGKMQEVNNKFETEIKGLRNLIENTERYCDSCSYDFAAKNTYIDEKCKPYVDIFIPIVAVSPDIFNLLIKERASLKPYLEEKMNEYLRNRPQESEVEKEFIDILEKTKIFSVEGNGNIELNYFTSIQVMVRKYGFSQEVLGVANKIDPKLFTMVLHLYDTRLKEARMLTDGERIKIKKDIGKLGFRRGKILDNDIETVRKVFKYFGIEKKDIRFQEWAVDKNREHFLIKLQGNGFTNKEDVAVFAFCRNDNFVRIEAIYDVAGRAMDGCGVYWQIKRIQIPLEMKEEKISILTNVYDAFMAYGIGFDAIVDEFTLNFHCEPEILIN